MVHDSLREPSNGRGLLFVLPLLPLVAVAAFLILMPVLRSRVCAHQIELTGFRHSSTFWRQD